MIIEWLNQKGLKSSSSKEISKQLHIFQCFQKPLNKTNDQYYKDLQTKIVPSKPECNDSHLFPYGHYQHGLSNENCFSRQT